MINQATTLMTRFFDKTGTVATLTAAMGCASCFPALGSLASSFGMGFLAQYEGVFVNTLLPLFATIVIVANSFAFIVHRIWYRGLLAIAGPTMVLLTLYPLWSYNWSTELLYIGLAIMLCISIWDLFSPPQKLCISNTTKLGSDEHG